MTPTEPPIAVAVPPRDTAAIVVSALTVAALVLLGFSLGVVGVLLVPALPHVLHVPLPVSWVFAMALYPACRLAQRAWKGWWPPLLPTAGWCLVVLPLWAWRPGGDLFVAYDDSSLLFVLIGLTSAAATVGTPPLGPRRRRPSSPGPPIGR